MVMKRHKRIAASATTYILLIIALVWTIFPVYWMIKSLRKESKVVQTKKQYGDFSLTALSFASISIFSG